MPSLPPSDTRTLTTTGDFVWLLRRFTEDTPGIEHVVLVSSDGVCLAASTELDRERADQLSAIVSGLQSLAEGVGRHFDRGTIEQLLLRMARGHLVVMAVGDGSRIAALTAAETDLRVLAYQMTRLTESVGHALTPHLRAQLQPTAPTTADKD
ncbi:roadblock/LC7 domain-containing protein [Streptomonospora arabica]|uniref:Roadblock/LC7 domain-containing protein n=1 Tax=Streptomonospora arabica TaxID=412417 RepID=A0ABV9SGC7_9ACTN